MELFRQIATIYAWGAIAILLLFLYLIARFYERKAGQRSYYRFFLIPMGLFLFAAISYAFFAADFVGAPAGDAAFFAGGMVMFLLGYFLLDLMTG
jgi:hypothetical protein